MNTLYKKLLTDIGFIVLLNLLLKPIWILVDNSAQNEIGHFSYGMFTAAFSFSFLFYQLLDMGVSSVTVKNISIGLDDISSFVKDSFYLKLLLSFLYILIVVGFYFFSYRKPELLEFIIISSLYHVFLSFYTWLRAILQGLQKFKIDAFFSILDKIILLILILYFIWLNKLDINNYAYSFLLSSFISALILSSYVIIYLDFYNFKFRIKAIIRLFFGTIFLAVVNVLFAFNDRLIFVLIDDKLSFSDTGLYYASYRWVNAISTYLWTILPYFYAKFSFELNDKSSHTDSNFHIKHLLTFVPILFVSAFVFSSGKVLFWQQTKSTPEELDYMAQLLSIQMIGLLLNSWLTIFGTFLNATNNERFVSSALVFGTIFNYLLIKYNLYYFGIFGAAWANVIFYAIVGFGFYYFFKDRNPYHYKTKHFVSQFFAIIVFIMVSFLLKRLNLPFLVPEIISITSFLTIMVISGEVNIRLIREVFRK